jgi:hypothetical protein
MGKSNSGRLTKLEQCRPPFDWIPVEAWDTWVAVRLAKGSRAPITEGVLLLAAKMLAKYRDQGWPPEVVLNHSAISGYTGVYPPTKDQSMKGPSRAELEERDRKRQEELQMRYRTAEQVAASKLIRDMAVSALRRGTERKDVR